MVKKLRLVLWQKQEQDSGTQEKKKIPDNSKILEGYEGRSIARTLVEIAQITRVEISLNRLEISKKIALQWSLLADQLDFFLYPLANLSEESRRNEASYFENILNASL